MKRSRINPKRKEPRRGPMRDPAFLAYLRTQPCDACKAIDYPDRLRPCGIVQAAHGPVNGMSSKGPDVEAIALGEGHHREQHEIGWPAFEAKYKFNRAQVAARHYLNYLTEKVCA